MGKPWKKLRRSGVWATWLISYMLVLAFPVLAHSITLIVASNAVETEARQSNRLLLQQLRGTLDGRLEDALRVRDLIRSDESLRLLFPMRFPLDVQTRYNLWKASCNIAQKIAPNRLVENAYMYVHGMDQTLCNSSIYSLQLTMDVVHGADDLTMEAWRTQLTSYQDRPFVTIERRDGSRRIALLAAMPIVPFYHTSATLVLLLDSERLLDDVSLVNAAGESKIYLINQNNEIIATEKSGPPPMPISYAALEHDAGDDLMELHGVKMLVTYATSRQTGWKYVSITPLRLLENRMGYLRTLTMGSMILSALLGLGLAYGLARRKSVEVEALLHKLERADPEEKAWSENGYARMDRLLDNVLRRTDRLDRLISSQKDMLKQHAVTCLLHSSVEGASSLCGLDFAYDHFAVVLLFFNETMDTTMESAERNARLMASAQIIREACSAWNAPYLLLHGHMAVLLFNLPQDTLSAVQMQELTESIRACSHRGQAEQCFLGASISAVVSGVERIHAAYAEALSWVNYALLSPPQEEAIYHSQSDKAREPVITSAQEELLISTVASGKTEAALKLFDQLCLPLQGAPTVPHFAKCFFYHIVACLVRSVRGGNGTQWMEAELCALEQATNIVGQQDAVRRAVETIANHHAQTQKDSGNVLLEEIFQLIACHYADPDFNATQIARMTERNPSYLSKYFKDCTGMGLYDYLLRFRIAKAKELIDHSDAPISSLIHQAGFENPGSFIRIFKKFEGITPGVYQNRPKSQ